LFFVKHSFLHQRNLFDFSYFLRKRLKHVFWQAKSQPKIVNFACFEKQKIMKTKSDPQLAQVKAARASIRARNREFEKKYLDLKLLKSDGKLTFPHQRMICDPSKLVRKACFFRKQNLKVNSLNLRVF